MGVISRMDFYVDVAFAVLLRLLKDRKGITRYYAALAKLYLAIRTLADVDQKLEAEILSRDTQR